jgi:hypothetical protein
VDRKHVVDHPAVKGNMNGSPSFSADAGFQLMAFELVVCVTRFDQ